MTRALRLTLTFFTVIWLSATITFLALRVLPGDAIQAQLIGSGVSLATIEERRSEQRLNDPIWLQYVVYLTDLMQGKFGFSLIDGQPVTEMIFRNLMHTSSLAIGAIIFGTLFGIVFGIVAARDIHFLITVTVHTLINLSLSLPIYWTGTLAIYVFSAHFGLLPSTGAGRFSQIILPVSILGFHTGGSIARLVEANIREMLTSDFVRTARAKGLREGLIFRKHILRVGLMPVITVVLLQTGFLFSGTVITEQLFVRPGLGRLLLDRTLQQDYPVVQGIVVLTAIIYTGLNTLGEFIYPLIDPRVAK